MFWNLSSSSISLATVTPSLVTVGAPHDFSMTTLRPRGPRVTLTASARVFTPTRMRERALSSNRMSLAAMCLVSLLLDDPEDLVLAEDQVLDAVALALGARVLAEQHAVALLDVQRADLAVISDLAVADGHHFALDRLLLGRIGDDDAPLGLLFFGQALDDQPVLQRTNFHEHVLRCEKIS